jgi:RNA polymerase sigma-70 factor (ECF subfamily)
MDNSKDYSEKSDIELVNLSLEDQENFIYLVDRYKGKLLSYIRRLTNIDPEECEDILQEVFIKIYLNLNDFDSDLKFSSWVYRIAHNEVISQYRKIKARPQGHKVSIDDSEVKELADEMEIDKKIDNKILREEIEKALVKIDVKYREVLVLKYFEEKNYQEISDIIKKPIGTVATYMRRGKKELKIKLK